MAKKFKIGDVVQLNSGGSLMTVEGYNSLDAKLVMCGWHEKNKHQRENYHEDTLVKYDPTRYAIITV